MNMGLATRAFLLLFLPLGLAVYWLMARWPRARLAALLTLSLAFYALAGGGFWLLLLGLSLATYWMAQRRFFGAGVGLNLLALAVFKYWDFGMDAAAHLLGEAAPLVSLALPLGISFYVFKHVGYLLDVRLKRYPASTDLLAFLTYSAYFPQVSAGPLSGYAEMARQFTAIPARMEAASALNGLIHISFGLAKKVLIADVLLKTLQAGFYGGDLAALGWVGAWLSVLIFAFQLYFDFSGYTDMALGVSLLFGVSLPPNFDNPYQSANITQFWQRWHISLSAWFRLYLYLPLSRRLLSSSLFVRLGTAGKESAQALANLTTMLLIGMWHGTGWMCVLWGGYHGLLLSLRAWLNGRGVRLPSHRLATFLAVLVGWALFASPSLDFAGQLFAGMLGLHGIGNVRSVLTIYDRYTLATLGAAILITLAGVVEAKNLPAMRKVWLAVLWGAIALLCVLQLGEKIEFAYVLF
jgi:D-alanyl-lipoteichoic acid acyltransferase DltB (MBOAT superfamily)